MSETIKNIDKKKLLMIALIIIVIIGLLIGGSLLYYNLFNKKSYSDIENIMVNAASEYLEKHPKELPTTEGETINIKVNNLVSAEYMKPISEYLKEETTSCEGSINVTKKNTNYRYVALLDCGKNYNYKTLTNAIKEKEPIVTSGNGLYQINEDLVFRGENINNYVSFSDNIWRIVKITNDKVMLIYNDKLGKTAWDDRYNREKESNVGINDYSVSRIKESLEELYNGDTLFTEKEKLLLSNFDIPIGKISETDNDKSGNTQKSNTWKNQSIGLLPIYDYMNASLDNNCNSTTSLSCTNYNYIIEYEYNFWTPIADSNTSYYVYQISSYDGAYLSKASANGYIRPVIVLAGDTLYTNGDGTIANPYTFK